MKILSLIYSSFFIFVFQHVSYSQDEDKIKTAIKKIADMYLGNENNCGLAIGIIRASSQDNTNPAPEYFYFGEIKKGSDIKPNDKTIFKMGSIGKTFSAMLLAYFASNKSYNVNLNDTISKFFPANMKLPVYKNREGREFEITLLDLATHFSSLPRSPSNNVASPDYTVEKLTRYLESYELTTMPGITFLYSNLGFGLLGYIMTIIGKKDYQQLESEIFLDELGMYNTRVILNDEQLSRLAHSYVKGKEMKFNVISSPGFYGAGGNYSTMSDMMKYLKYNLNMGDTRINYLLDTMHIIRKSTGKPYLKWMALGWQISELISLPGTKFIWKDGGTNGFTTYIAFEKTKGTGIAVLSNSKGASVIGKKIINLLNETN